MAADWASLLARARERVADGERRLPRIGDEDARQRQLTRLGNAACAAGLCLLMLGRRDEAAEWLELAAVRWRQSYDLAPPGSWGRPVGAIKARVLAGDWAGARADAEWSLAEGGAASESPIGRYAACLALLVLGRDAEALTHAESLRGRADFPTEVAAALAALAAVDADAYAQAAAAVLLSFETREAYLEDVPVADTVLVLQRLAVRRGIAIDLTSPLLPLARTSSE
jgi:hypothetical protein